MIIMNLKDMDNSFFTGDDKIINEEVKEVIKVLYRKDRNTFNRIIALGELNKIFIEAINEVDKEYKQLLNNSFEWKITEEQKLSYSE